MNCWAWEAGPGPILPQLATRQPHRKRDHRMSTNTALDQIKARVEGHSPTPWAVMDVNDPGEGVNFIDVYSETDGFESVCRLPNPAEYSTREGLQADAELIAAAPKLLAALEAVEARLSAWQEHAIGMSAEDCTTRALVFLLRNTIEEALR